MIVHMKERYELQTERLRELVDRSGLSYGQLEIQTGLSKSQLSLTLAGKRTNIWANTLATLASYFGVSMDYLMGLTDKATPVSGYMMPEGFTELWNIHQGMGELQRWQTLQIARVLARTSGGIAMRNGDDDKKPDAASLANWEQAEAMIMGIAKQFDLDEAATVQLVELLEIIMTSDEPEKTLLSLLDQLR